MVTKSDIDLLLREINEAKQEIVDVTRAALVDKLSSIEKRIGQVEERIFLGNGQPSITSRLCNLEMQSENTRDEVCKIYEQVSILPLIQIELKAIQHKLEQENAAHVSYKSSRIGGAYQILAAILTVILGVVVGMYTTHRTENEIRDTVIEILSQVEQNGGVHAEKM